MVSRLALKLGVLVLTVRWPVPKHHGYMRRSQRSARLVHRTASWASRWPPEVVDRFVPAKFDELDALLDRRANLVDDRCIVSARFFVLAWCVYHARQP